MDQTQNQGFESPKHEYSMQSKSILISKCPHDKAKTILKDTHHSLEADMVMGWKPKLPSCPLPLSYRNIYNQQLMEHIPTDDRFKIVYVGKRPVNSVQVNQQYSYFWKYRQRYSLNIALVQDAVKNIGSQLINFSQDVQNTVTRKQLLIDSSFESGNLELAVRVKPNEYDLFLRSDTNTKGHTNWYYFKVNNQDFLGNVQFSICNMGKTKTLYNKGMKPYVLEDTQLDTQSPNSETKWTQSSTFDVCFVERYCRYGFEKKTYQLQFKYNFKKPNTTVYFAYGIPYTYSHMESFINEITQSHKDIVRCEKLCESLGGLNLPLLMISNSGFIKQKDQNKNFDLINQSRSLSIQENIQNVDQNKNKKAVLITGRIHPGQSNSSHVLEGFIRELLKDDEVSVKLRNMYVFYIIPMLNPDGVVAGNFRTSYSGKDLNRQFNKLNKFIYPQIYYLDEFTAGLKQKYKRRLQFYFDFHGHSSKKNLFCYGPEHQPSNILFFKCRTFAKIIEEMNPIFSYRKSIFQVSEHKKSTGRAHMLWNFKIPMTYTFEISNGLYETKQQRNGLLSRQTMLQSGKAIYKGLCKYVSLETRNFGSQIAKAKVDSGIRSRKLSSEKLVRQNSQKIQRNTSKQIQETKQNSLKNTIDLEAQMKQSVEFEKYIKEIKKESFENSEIEGGSDSQESEDDLSAEELAKLHDFVKSRNEPLRDTSNKHYSFKIKPVLNKTRQRKNSVQEIDEANKENIPFENNRQKTRSINGIDTSRRLYQMSQKLVPIKKPPLPIPVVNTKFVLCQKKFEIQF